MRIALVRGPYIHQAEMANYVPLLSHHTLTGFRSSSSRHKDFPFPLEKLSSPFDLPAWFFPSPRVKMAILNRVFGDGMILWGLEERLRGFDIAHSAETYFYFTKQCLDAKAKGYVKKVVVTVWENIAFNNEGIWRRKEFKKRAIRDVDHFLAVTNDARNALLLEGCDPRKISVVPMGVDLMKFEDRSSKLEEVSNKKNTEILFVGRLEKEKGVWELLEAFRRLIQNKELRNKNCELKIIGQGRETERMIRQVKEWEIEHWVTIESRNYNDMPEAYQRADIFVLPSKQARYWQEQYGMVLVEAMASGLPIIATDSGSIPEVVGNAAILIPPDDSISLYNALVQLIDNPQRAKKIACIARKRAEEYFDTKKIAKKIEGIYSND